MLPKRSSIRFSFWLALSLCCLILVIPSSSEAQNAAEDWRTLELPHYRIHYPVEFEVWTLDMASRLEAVHQRLVPEIGFELSDRVDVLVVDPFARANGSAFPLLGRPRMVLFATPPGPSSGLAGYRSWSELLTVHEGAHLVHLMRPSRKSQRVPEQAWPFGVRLGPITRKAPRWVTEGYATVIEGRLTGLGRPHGSLRAALLRRRALAGELPSYGALAQDDQLWLGPSMAYLAGSAFLEWLEQREGPDSLPKLWARMTARHDRSFDEAFVGVFGDSPKSLWGEFKAELTWQAKEIERRLAAAEAGLGVVSQIGMRTDPETNLAAPGQVEGELWQDLAWGAGAPAVSPSGDRLAVVLSQREGPSRLVVWSTAPNEEAETKFQEKLDEILSRDPEDVAPVRRRPLPREPLATIAEARGFAPLEPRWLADGKSLVFVRFEPDAQGDHHPDLFLWNLDTDSVGRLTWGSDLREADPSRTGSWAIALRSRYGLNQLVRIDLESGVESELTELSLNPVVASPRVSPDGSTLAYFELREGAWHVVLQDLETDGQSLGSRRRDLALPNGSQPSEVAWRADGKALYASLGLGGFIDLWELAADPSSDEAPRRLTRTLGAALAPEADAQGGLFFLSMEADGLDLRHLSPISPTQPTGSDSGQGSESLVLQALEPSSNLPLDFDSVPVTPPPAPSPAPFEAVEVGAAEPYGWGPQEAFWNFGFQLSPSGRRLDLGVHGGDVVGRLGWSVRGFVGDQGADQGAVAQAKILRWPVKIEGGLWWRQERPSEQKDFLPPAESLALPITFDLDRQSFELGLGWQRGSGQSLTSIHLEGDLLLGQVKSNSQKSVDERIASLAARFGYRPGRGEWSAPISTEVFFQDGETGPDTWQRWGYGIEAGLLAKGSGLTLSYRRTDSASLETPLERFRLGGLNRYSGPDAIEFGRIEAPWLTADTLLGTAAETQALAWQQGAALDGAGGLGLRWFAERHRLENDGLGWSDWLRAVGLEFAWSMPANGVLGLPQLQFKIGAAWVLDAPFEDEVKLWAAFALRP